MHEVQLVETETETLSEGNSSIRVTSFTNMSTIGLITSHIQMYSTETIRIGHKVLHTIMFMTQ